MEKTNDLNEIQTIEKRGFHRWAWLIIILLGGLLMVFGGVQDLLIFFKPGLEMVPSWHPIPSVVGLICGLIVSVSALSNIILGLLIRCAVGAKELKLAYFVVVTSGLGLAADLTSGYYGFGCLIALLVSIWLICRFHKTMD